MTHSHAIDAFGLRGSLLYPGTFLRHGSLKHPDTFDDVGSLS
jgi:hypothetical protein